MRTRFDEVGKELVEAAIEVGGKVELEYRVVGPGLRVDIWFEPDPARRAALEPAGLLGRMAGWGPCLIETYRNTPGLREMASCVCKQQILQHGSMRQAGRMRTGERGGGGHLAGDSGRTGGFPRTRLWLVTPGRPRTILEAYGMVAMVGWPRGCYASPQEIDARHVVVASELPASADTLLVRLLGRGRTFERAWKELQALPEEVWEKRLAMPLLLAYGVVLPQDSGEDDMSKRLQRARAIYAEWEANVKRQGHADVVLRQLARRFGPLPETAVTRVERANLAEIDGFADRLLTADSLDAVFAGE